MTTAHRPTFDPAVGKEAQRGPAYHQRLLPAHTQLKVRKPGQGGSADSQSRDLRAELLAAEAAHFAKTRGGAPDQDSVNDAALEAGKRGLLESGAMEGVEDDNEAKEAKRRKILEETRDIDADSASESESESEDESEDETAELQRELEKIKRERAERREAEEREKAAAEEEARERDMAGGNPLMGGGAKQDFGVKRRWDDDVIFRNQARGTEGKDKKEFVNDLLRSDFHKRFMSKYVR
ncbi:complexed with cef1p [Pseudogymnoascus destructans]|uniref:Complexed with cef1p n=2 Tax=Pseudogymnoascus destructans TaxID=655981 RepID=L8G0X3_PSED2|nr:complexed with cef1p [Pseudogymnoascus destructans]ELR06930.1 hypothetical protein GMDG_02300 [Pseudogymnoascus destructans 20631-21]OAF57187.1 complexed with cef1p [Pseudogymnoascus destructans]